jgi:hypothetical protein
MESAGIDDPELGGAVMHGVGNVEHRRRRFKRITLLNPGRRALK